MSDLTFSDPQRYLVTTAKVPFGVFIDTSDGDWEDDDFIRRCSVDLMKAGCRWFVCFGPSSEVVHDRIDDFVLEYDFKGVMTTYHFDETPEETAEFFTDIALMNVKQGIILVRDQTKWAKCSKFSIASNPDEVSS